MVVDGAGSPYFNGRRHRMTRDLQEIAQQVLQAAKRAGADAADALIVDGASVSIEVRAGALEHAERSEGTDLGLRVFKGKRQATVSISDLSGDAIAEMAERAVLMASVAPEDPYCGLADPSQLAKQWDVEALDLFDRAAAPEPDALQEAALQAEAAALNGARLCRRIAQPCRRPAQSAQHRSTGRTARRRAARRDTAAHGRLAGSVRRTHFVLADRASGRRDQRIVHRARVKLAA
jgi:hypothetical protein